MFHRRFAAAAGARLSRALTVLWLSVTVLLGLLAGVAQAELPKLVFYGNFGTGPVLADGVAVDQPSGDVYVASFASPSFTSFGHVDEFDAGGRLLSPPSSFGEGLDSGTAVNPTNRAIYVLNAATSEVDTYEAGSGQLLSSFPVPGSPTFLGLTVVQIAADSAGDVYVPVAPENEVLEYSPTGTLIRAFTGSGAGTLKEPIGVAVDSSGNVWVADTGDNRIEEFSSTGSPVGEIRSEGVSSVALDGRGDVFAIAKNNADFCGSVPPPCSHLVEYNSSGVQIADVGAGSFEGGAGFRPPMVAVSESSGRVYVSDGAKELVWIFGPPTTPAVSREFTAEVTASQARLGALVNPGGLETVYRFEYDSREYREGEGPHGQSIPTPEGTVGIGATARAVWAAASGLTPGTIYHYRVVATNALGTVVGPDRTFTTETVEQAACPNEQLREGFSARLPDCRAYELVTATTKTSVQFRGEGGRAASDGNAVSFQTHEPLPGAATGGNYYVASRSSAGWTLADMIPLESYTGVVCSSHSNEVPAYEENLLKAVVSDGFDTRASQPGATQEACNAEGLQVVSGEPVGYQNLLLRENNTGTYRLINAPPPGVTPGDAHFQGASSDLSHVVFTETAPLTPNAPPGGVEDLYEWDEGTLRIMTVLPNGTAVSGSLAQAENGASAISADGSHALFTSSGGLYMRIDGEHTVQVDESQGSSPSGGGSFQALSADGSKVLFLDEGKLTAGSTAEAGEPDLYECTLPEGASKCELTDLTVAQPGEHADVLRVSTLGSKNSSHVYFLAKGVLASNMREHLDAEGKPVVERAMRGEENLYLDHAGTITFIATLNGSDYGVGVVSPNGRWFAFGSHNNLTGYDNFQPNGVAAEEIFLYDATSNRLVCASCNPSGEAPVLGGGATLALSKVTPRYLANGGRLFFDTLDALVPSDTDGQTDVYEYEHGQPQLISGGTSSSESTFIDAGKGGDDVFFLSRQQLVPQDTEAEAQVIYDARADGGLPAISSPSACTTADNCRAPVSPQPSIYGPPSSQTLEGAGNLPPASKAKPKAKPRKKGKRNTCQRLRNKHRRAVCEAKHRKSKRKAKRNAKSHKGGK
jgi:hypothetical protein